MYVTSLGMRTGTIRAIHAARTTVLYTRRVAISINGPPLIRRYLHSPSLSPSPLPPPPLPLMSQRVGLCGSDAAAALTELDWKILNWQQGLKHDLCERPKQTGFRVFSILTYTPDEEETKQRKPQQTDQPPISTPHPYDNHNYVHGTDKKLAFVTGTNTEPCFIGNSICSERSAILQMRMKAYKTIEKLYITADSDSIITPGLLCREMLCEFLTLDTPIILASVNAQMKNGFDVQVANLRVLFPYPSIYLNVPGSAVAEYAQKFHSTCDKLTSDSPVVKAHPACLDLYSSVVAYTAKDLRPSLHPLRYAAGVLFADGSTRLVAMTKLLEYGWSLDAIVKLIPYMEDKRAAGVKPVLVILADQFGNLHSPSAPGRSHLSEGGYEVDLVFHDRHGKLVYTNPRSIAPDVPDAIEDVLPSTVLQSTASQHSASV